MSDALSQKDVSADLRERLEHAYDADGVDRSLIRSSLGMTPVERLRALESLLEALETVRRVER